MTLKLISPIPEQQRQRLKDEADAAMRAAIDKLAAYKAECLAVGDQNERNLAHSVAAGIGDLQRRLWRQPLYPGNVARPGEQGTDKKAGDGK